MQIPGLLMLLRCSTVVYRLINNGSFVLCVYRQKKQIMLELRFCVYYRTRQLQWLVQCRLLLFWLINNSHTSWRSFRLVYFQFPLDRGYYESLKTNMQCKPWRTTSSYCMRSLTRYSRINNIDQPTLSTSHENVEVQIYVNKNLKDMIIKTETINTWLY